MKKIIAFAGSNSSTSINQKLVNFATSQLKNCEINSIKLTPYELPIFSEDVEKSEGYSDSLNDLLLVIKEADAVLMSVNEHNGAVSAFFKNVLDWLSRVEYKFLDGKKVFLMSASPGKRGALSAQEYTAGVLPRFGAAEVTRFTLPSFKENFADNKITNSELAEELASKLSEFEDSL